MSNSAFHKFVLVTAGAICLLVPIDGLRALGLGEARVDSYLGQPLDVSIRLLEAESENIEGLTVGPASIEDHERLGIPAESLGLGLEVTVDRRTDPPRVRVRSRQTVNDPIIQILVDARWSSGRVLREYTLFLDPPTMDTAPPVRRAPAGEQAAQQPAEAPEPEARPAQPSPEPEPQRRAEREPAPERERDVAARGGETVAVAAGDTLWSIASEWRPDPAMSMDQVMLAIFERNRRAFLDDNINRLRSDTRLTMPELEAVGDIGRAEAERRIREHMQAWRQERAGDVPVVSDAGLPEAEPAAETEPAAEPAAEPAEPEVVHRLDVVPPEEGEAADGTAVSDEEIREVRNSVTRIEEEILAEGLESEEFDQRIEEVRDALDQRDMAGLAIAEESLAELEQRLREVRQARAEEQALAAEDEPADEVDSYLRELERELAGEETGEGDATEPVADDDEAQAADDQEAAGDEAEPAAEDESAADEMAVTRTSGDGWPLWWWLAGAGVLVLIAAGGVVVWRRRAGEDHVAGESERDAVSQARAALRRAPADLAAHLALLRALGDTGDARAFGDAFDQMYQQVDDESVPEWQQALSLAAAHVPDHPLLTPQEVSVEDEDADAEFERRADEMLGMLDTEEPFADEADSESETVTAPREDLDLGPDEDEPAETDETASAAATDDDEGDELSEDMDLAVLSERLDDPSMEPGQDKSLQAPGEEEDFRQFEEDQDEYEEAPVEEEAAGEADEAPDADTEPVAADEDEARAPGEDLDLDFEFTSDADRELSGETDTEVPEFAVDEDADDTLPAGFDVEPESDEAPAESGESPAQPEEAPGESSAESPEAGSESESAGGGLSDEDADVKLDLARAYISVDLADSARTVLEEVVSDGSPEKQEEARKLLDDL